MHNRTRLRACLHGGGGPQAGELTRSGGVTPLSVYSLMSICLNARGHVMETRLNETIERLLFR